MEPTPPYGLPRRSSPMLQLRRRSMPAQGRAFPRTSSAPSLPSLSPSPSSPAQPDVPRRSSYFSNSLSDSLHEDMMLLQLDEHLSASAEAEIDDFVDALEPSPALLLAETRADGPDTLPHLVKTLEISSASDISSTSSTQSAKLKRQRSRNDNLVPPAQRKPRREEMASSSPLPTPIPMDADSLASPDSSPPLSPIDDDFGSYSGGAGSGGGYLFPSSSSNSLGSATYSGSSQSHQVHYPPARSLSGSNPARSSSRSFTLTGPFQPSSSSPSSPHAAQPPPAPFAQSPPMSPASFSGTGDPFADPGDGEVYPCPIAGCRHLYKFKGDLKHHVLQKHPDFPPQLISPPQRTKEGKEFPCPRAECNSGFVRRHDLLRHLRMKHPDLYALEKEGFKTRRHSDGSEKKEGKESKHRASEDYSSVSVDHPAPSPSQPSAAPKRAPARPPTQPPPPSLPPRSGPRNDLDLDEEDAMQLDY